MSKARDLANAGTALTSVSATELGYVDGVTSAIQTQIDSKIGSASAINPTIVDAKGDIIAATAADTVARLAVGANATVLTADSAEATGLKWATVSGAPDFLAGKNKIINGDFYINQRNFTSNTSSGSYNFDRWLQVNGGTTGTLTVTPQTFTAGTAPVAGYEGKNYIQCITASGASVNTYAMLEQRIEDVRSFAAQTVTVSFWAKANTGTPKIGIELEQDFGTGGSPSATVYTSTSVTISTSWTRYSATVAIPSISGKTIGTTTSGFLGTNLWLSSGSDFAVRAASIGLQNATFQVWGVQVEAGSTATPFSTATGSIATELAACQRYAYVPISDGYMVGFNNSTTQGRCAPQFPVTMRAAPTATYGTWSLTIKGSAGVTGTSVQNGGTSVSSAITLINVSSGLTAGEGNYAYPTNNSTIWSAEL